RPTGVPVNPAAATNRLAAGPRPDQTSGSGALNTSASLNGVTVAADAAFGLMAAYGFNEGSGSVSADGSGFANTATLNSAAWTTGKFANAVSFNGSSSFVEAPDTNALTP